MAGSWPKDPVSGTSARPFNFFAGCQGFVYNISQKEADYVRFEKRMGDQS